MMIKQVFFKCEGCFDENLKLGQRENYREVYPIKFESLTEAFKHIQETGHEMKLEYDEYEEQE